MHKLTQLKNFYRIFLLKKYRYFCQTVGYTPKISRFLFSIIVIAAWATLVFFIVDFINLIFGSGVRLGEFGDFLGGTLNPIFTFLTLLGLLATIILQKKELSLARREFSRSAKALEEQQKNLEQQRFENTYFKLLERLDYCQKEFFIYTKPPEFQKLFDVDGFSFLLRKLHSDYLTKYLLDDRFLREFDSNDTGSLFKVMRDCYKEFNCNEVRGQLTQYFNSLRSIFEFFNSSAVENVKFYADLLYIRLTEEERTLFFYYAASLVSCEDTLVRSLKKYNFFKITTSFSHYHLYGENLSIENEILAWFNNDYS